MSFKGKKSVVFFGCFMVIAGMAEDIFCQDDSAVAEQLFSAVKKAEEKGYSFTQSQAHVSMPKIQNYIKKLTGLVKNKDIINQCMKKEEELKKSYYVFYTAIPHLRLFQDITKKLYVRTIGKTGALQDKAFQFIRYTYNDSVFNEYKNVTDFLEKQISNNGIIDDNITQLKTILVSTNIAFFGNAGFTGESTYYYFNSPQPWARAKRQWLDSCLKSFGFSTAYAEELLNLQELIKTDMGDLFQIFIPKKNVNDIGYLSWRQGIPFDISFISKVFMRPNLTFSREDEIYAQEITDRIANIKQKWQKKDTETVELVTNLLTNIKAGKYHLDTFLERYTKNPKSLPYLNYYQARLLVTNDMLLNPKSGLLIYRYSKLDPLKEQAYKTKLNAIIDRMLVEKGFAQDDTLKNLKKELETLTDGLKNLTQLLKQRVPAAP